VPGEKFNWYKNVLKDIFFKDQEKLNRNEWGKIENTARLLFESGVNPLGIGLLCKNIAQRWGEKYLTINSISGHTNMRYEAIDGTAEDFEQEAVIPEYIKNNNNNPELARRKKAYNDKRVIEQKSPLRNADITEEMLNEVGL